MADPSLVATIVTAGGVYSTWKSVQIERTIGAPMSYLTFEAAEPGPSTSPPSWSNLQLMPGDPVQGLLAGQLVISGNVMVRQASYESNQHEIQIVVASYTQNGDNTTVDGKSGQYLNSTLQQIANAVMGPVGVTVMVDNLPNADKPFPRVSEHIGEGRLDFLRRLGMMRDLHQSDDENGTLHYTRGDGGSSQIAALIEGVNILKGRIVLNRGYVASDYIGKMQQPGGSSTGITQASKLAQITSTVKNADYSGPHRPITIIGQMPGDAIDANLLASHELALDQLQSVEAVVTVPGWLAPNGTPWCLYQNLGKRVVINSPMLIPQNPFYLLLRGARHMQDNELGSVTELNLCTFKGLSSQDTIFGSDNSSVPFT